MNLSLQNFSRSPIMNFQQVHRVKIYDSIFYKLNSGEKPAIFIFNDKITDIALYNNVFLSCTTDILAFITPLANSFVENVNLIDTDIRKYTYNCIYIKNNQTQFTHINLYKFHNNLTVTTINLENSLIFNLDKSNFSHFGQNFGVANSNGNISISRSIFSDSEMSAIRPLFSAKAILIDRCIFQNSKLYFQSLGYIYKFGIYEMINCSFKNIISHSAFNPNEMTLTNCVVENVSDIHPNAKIKNGTIRYIDIESPKLSFKLKSNTQKFENKNSSSANQIHNDNSTFTILFSEFYDMTSNSNAAAINILGFILDMKVENCYFKNLFSKSYMTEIYSAAIFVSGWTGKFTFNSLCAINCSSPDKAHFAYIDFSISNPSVFDKMSVILCSPDIENSGNTNSFMLQAKLNDCNISNNMADNSVIASVNQNFTLQHSYIFNNTIAGHYLLVTKNSPFANITFSNFISNNASISTNITSNYYLLNFENCYFKSNQNISFFDFVSVDSPVDFNDDKICRIIPKKSYKLILIIIIVSIVLLILISVASTFIVFNTLSKRKIKARVELEQELMNDFG